LTCGNIDPGTIFGIHRKSEKDEIDSIWVVKYFITAKKDITNVLFFD
jgi:hypothetical protein